MKAAALIAVAAVLLLAGCGGGEATTTPGGAQGGTVAPAELAAKIGLTSNGAGEYRLDGCAAKAMLTSAAAIQQAEDAGKDVVVDPTGHYGVEIEDRGHCAQVMRAAVAILNVP